MEPDGGYCYLIDAGSVTDLCLWSALWASCLREVVLKRIEQT